MSAEISSLLNNQSGLYGLSGLSNDMRALLEHSDAGNERARLAIDVFCYRVKKYIGAYYAALNGADAVIFAGGIGENAPSIRAALETSCGAWPSLPVPLHVQSTYECPPESMTLHP